MLKRIRIETTALFKAFETPLFAKCFVLALVLCAAPSFAPAEDARKPPQAAGLMWNRSGLPAVFPLQVKTSAGQDYLLTLVDDDTGEDALAAFIEGGTFFKVLVPPGVFRLRFATGEHWQGEEALFGSGEKTHIFELETPLTFKVLSLGTKAGHLVDITGIDAGKPLQARVKDQVICQTGRAEFPKAIYPSAAEKRARNTGQPGWVEGQNGRLKYLDAETLKQEFNPNLPEYHLPSPQFLMWSEYCE